MSELTMLVSLCNIATRVITQQQLAQEIHDIMDDLGDQEYRNAGQALQDATISSDPRHELISAVNHLQSSASSYESIYAREANKSEFFRERVDQAAAIWNASQCYALIAVIYCQLGETQLKVKYAGKFITCKKRECALYDFDWNLEQNGGTDREFLKVLNVRLV